MYDDAVFRARRRFLTQSSGWLGAAALTTLLNPRLVADPAGEPVPGVLGRTHFAPRARNVIYLFMSGGPSHIDLFDHKPILRQRHGEEMPRSVLGDQRVTLMTRNQGHFQTATTPYGFRRVGRAGHEMSELWQHLPAVADELCIIKSMQTEPINHDPAIVFMQAGLDRSGLPCMGSWISYGLGSENHDLPAFVVMISGPLDQPLSSRHYNSGFLPAQHQGVQFQSGADPVLYLTSPDGVSREVRAGMIDGINELNRLRHARVGDPEIEARMRCFELAGRMQSSVPELVDIAGEQERTLTAYGPDVNTPGSFARNCLLARRLVERGCASCSFSIAAGTSTPTSSTTSAARRSPSISRVRPWCATWAGAACSTTRWSSGAANSAAPPTVRAILPAPSDATITRAVSPTGWPAAAFGPACRTARRMSMATTSPRTRSASTTCTRRSCTAWESTTSA